MPHSRPSPKAARWLPSTLGVGVVVLLFFGISNRAAAQSDPITETITNLTIDSGQYVIASDRLNPAAGYDRDVIRVSFDAAYQLNAGQPNQTGVYRIVYQLIDQNGTAAQLEGPGGPSDRFTAEEFTINFTNNVPINTAYAHELVPAAPLVPQFTYRVRALIEIKTAMGIEVARQADTVAQNFFHFTSLDSNDAAPNVLLFINNIQVLKFSALETANAAALQKFRARATVTAYRYDRFNAATPGNALVPFRLDYRFREQGTNTAVPMNDGFIQPGFFLDEFATQAGVKVPVVLGGLQVDFDMHPSQILNSLSKRYYVNVSASHDEDGTSRFDGARNGAAVQLLHMSGALVTGAIQSIVRGLETDPALAFTDQGTHIEFSNRITAGNIAGHPGYTIRLPLGGAMSNFELFDDGRLELAAVNPFLQVDNPNHPGDVDTASGIQFERTSVLPTLSPAGLQSGVKIRLPAGLGVYLGNPESAPPKIFDSEVSQVTFLDQSLAPVDPLVISPPIGADPNDVFALVEESKPVEIRGATLEWHVAAGEIRVGAAPAGVDRVRYMRRVEIDALSNAPLPNADKVVYSNELLYKNATGANGDVVVSAGADGSAKLSAEITTGGTVFESHFPARANIAWDGAGTISIVDDVIDPSASTLTNGNRVFLPVGRNCEEAVASGCGTIGNATARLVLAGADLTVTPDGGISAAGTMGTFFGARRDVQIGYIDALSDGGNITFAHDTDPFIEGRFLMAGHFLPDLPQSQVDRGAAALLNSGLDVAQPAVMHRPGSQDYRDGAGDYPGMNYRAADEAADVAASSTIAGQRVTYALRDRSKYYLRLGGANGIHEPQLSTFPGQLVLYDYPFEFSNFGLSFLDSEVHDSTTAGRLEVPDPSDFVFEFDRLFFDCLGRPARAEPAGGSFATSLDFWSADIESKAAEFQPAPGTQCDPSDAFLTLGVRAYASNVPEPLFGTLGFRPDGELITAASGELENVDSRLVLPTSLRIKGPRDEIYTFHPLHNAYYNDYAQRDAGIPTGTLNFAGLLDVPFFEDLEVHFQTGARQGNTTDTIYMMAGWEEGSGNDTFFTTEQFDLGHRAAPPGATMSDYRALVNEIWRVRAQQRWLGIVNFDYPLDWDTTRRSFGSSEPESADLMVLSAEHELVYLSPEWAEIDFGASLDLDIPEINLANLGETLLEGSGVFDALEAAVGAQIGAVAGVFGDGIDQLGGVLEDRMDAFYDRIFELTIDPVVDQIAAEIKVRQDNFTDVQLYLIDQLCDSGQGVSAAFYEFADTGSAGSAALVGEIDDILAKAQWSIRALIGFIPEDGQIDLDQIVDLTVPEDTFAIGGQATAGLFAKQDGVGYDILRNLIAAIIDDLGEEAAAGLNALAGSVIDAINDELNALLEEAEPTIEDVKLVLMDVHNAIGAVRTNIGVVQNQIADIFSAAAGDIDAFMADAKNELLLFLGSVDITEYSVEELAERIRQEVRDRFNASPLIAEVQVVLKQYLYDLESALNEAISSLFGELNRMVVALLTSALPELDGELQGMLDDLSSISATADVDGYAQINGDALRKLRLDASMQLKLPDAMEFAGYLEINQLDSLGDDSCSFAGEGEYAAEVKIGANDIPVKWVGDDTRFNVGGKFTFDTADGFKLRGLGGSLEMTQGEIGIEAVTITSLGAAAMFGKDENYLAANVGMKFDQYQMAGGVFFGRTCTIDPLLIVDPDVAAVLGDPPFTGVYTYGEAQVPIVGASCLFSLQAGVGAGVFVFQEGPTVGGKMKLAAVGKALCAVTVGGEVVLVGTKSGNDFSFLGRGRIFGEVGVCPLCTKFNAQVELLYKDKKWEYDY